MPDIEGVPYETAGTALDVATAQALATRHREVTSAGVAAGTEAKALAQSVVAEVGTIRTAVAQSANSASAAAGSAAQAEQTADALVPRMEHIETMAGLAPGEVTDAQTANLVSQPDTSTRAALNAASVSAVDEGGVARPLLDSVFARTENVSEANGTLADLQAGLDRAAAKGVPLHVYGTYNLAGSLTAPATVHMVGIDSPKIHQTMPLTPHLVGANVKTARIRDVELVGHGGDYENTQTVYGATALRFTGANEDIDLERVKVTSIAGAGLFVESGATKRVRASKCIVTGVGQTVARQYSAGFIIQDGIQDIDLDSNDVSQIAQGMTVGHGSNRIRATFNRLHHTSEHGAYFAVSDNYIILGNHIYDTGLLGAKIQRGKAGTYCRAAIVDDNIFERTGSHAFMVTNAGIGAGEKFIRNFKASGNVAYDIADTAFRLDSLDKYTVSDTLVDGARFGIRVHDSTNGRLRANDVFNTERPGYWLQDIANTRFESNTGFDMGLVGPEKVGTLVLGTVSNLAMLDNDMDYAATGAQADGYLFGAGTYSNVRLRENRGRGSNWGFRVSSAASGITEWSRNFGYGSLGASEYPAGYVPNLADSSGYTLASLEAEVNKLKAIARTQRDARN